MGETRPATPSRAQESAQPNIPSDLADPELLQLTDQAKRGDLSGLRAYLARTRIEADWQDRDFVLDRVVPLIPLSALDFACDTEPQAADLFLIRTSYFSSLAWTKRGGGTADKIAEDRWRAASNCIQAALEALQKAAQLDPRDPTPYVDILQSLGIFEQFWPQMQYAFQKATELAPDLVPAYRPIVSIYSKRWGGSHEQSLDFARAALAKSTPGSDLAYLLFWAHFLVHTHFLRFDKDEQAAENYLSNPKVVSELNAAFDDWTRPPYVPRRSSFRYLHYAASWFYQVRDLDRLRAAFALIGNVFFPDPWNVFGEARTVHDRARLIASGKQSDEPENTKELDRCFIAIGFCLQSVKTNDQPRALASLVAAFQKTTTAPADQQPHLKALVMLNMAWLSQKMRKEEDAAKLRADATSQLDAITTPLQSARYQFHLAESLERLGESRRCISAWEQALAQAGEDTEPQRIATILQRMGEAYNRIGAREHAVIPLRSALQIFRSLPGDPRISSVLLSLGNALRKIDPSEAEACYRECASIHEAAMKPLSATPAWSNLGMLCSEQGRLEEALAYQRVLRIREQSQGTPRTSFALIHNNLANTYRRMRRFKDARASVDQAIKLLSSDDTLLPEAYETRGQIFEDSRDDKSAAEWYRKSCTERGKQPSPDLDDWAETLERAIAVLTRLGKPKDAAEMQQTLATVRSSLESVQQGEFDETKGKSTADSASVIIELRVGIHFSRPEIRTKVQAFTRILAEEARKAGAGRHGGSVTVPESTTLIFYGKDSEFLYRVLEPHLTSDALSAGAKVVIRQGSQHREILIPMKRESIN